MEHESNTKLKVIAGVLVAVLVIMVGYYLSIAGPNERGDDTNSDRDGIFSFFSGDEKERTNGTGEKWYVGYKNKRTQTPSYSQVFSSEIECIEYEKRIKDAPSLEVMLRCFSVAADKEGPDGVDVFETDLFIQQQEQLGGGLTQRERDTTPPTIKVLGQNPATVSVGGTYTDAGATAVDAKDGNLTSKIAINGLPVVTFRPSKFTITYRVTDGSGNTAYATREVRVVAGDPATRTQSETSTETDAKQNQFLDAATEPVIVLRGYNPVIVNFGDPYEDAGASAFDAKEGDISDSITVVAGLPIDTFKEGVNYVTYAVTGAFGQYVETTRVVEVVHQNIDMSSDIAYLESCYGKMARGLCEKVDVNGNGAVGESDREALIEMLFPFEVSGDPAIDFSAEGVVRSCFLKIDGGCAVDSNPNLEITRSYLTEKVYSALLSSTQSGNEYAINLGAFANKLGSATRDKMAYETFAQYDLNKDGIADLNGWVGGDGATNADKKIFDDCALELAVGDCVIADINKDGRVLQWDLGMFTIMQSELLPETFTVKELEDAVFDRTMYSDGTIVKHCNDNNTALGYCELADFDLDGDVDDVDEKMFYDLVPLYDFNGDGNLNGITLSL